MHKTLTLLLALLIAGLAVVSAPAVSAATVNSVLKPGPLTITNAPVTLTYATATADDTMRLLDATFTIGVTDATGGGAGWHIQAIVGPPARADGTPVPISSSIVTDAHVTTLTGTAPASGLAYPRPFRPGGDTVFSAAAGSGMGKSVLAFNTEIAVAVDTVNSNSLIATLLVTIALGP